MLVGAAEVWGARAAMQRRLHFIGLLALALGAATVTAASATPDSQPHNGDWIAYSTAPSGDQRRRGGNTLTGSDAFLVRAGGEPILVAGRGAGRTWNACPAFSPDGTKLAFGTKSPGRKSVSVVRVTRAGASAAQRVKLRVRGGNSLAPCPLWSADGSRLAYLLEGKVVVRGLDGSARRATAGDPVRDDFRARYGDPLVSPASDLEVLRSDPIGSTCAVMVARPDGSDRRVLPNPEGSCSYAVAAWSPDGRKLLVMRDVSGIHFSMYAVSVNAPFETVTIVERVRVNHGRSWPRRGDVSWQPRTS